MLSHAMGNELLQVLLWIENEEESASDIAVAAMVAVYLTHVFK